MKKTTNDNIRVRIKIPDGCEALVKELDRVAKEKGVTRSELCAEILSKAVGRASFCKQGVTSRNDQIRREAPRGKTGSDVAKQAPRCKTKKQQAYDNKKGKAK